MHNKKIIFLVIALVALVAGCSGSIWESESIGIGEDFSELKQSPCACIQLENKPGLPDWLIAS